MMKLIWAVATCGAFLAIASCGDTSPQLSCGSGTVAVDRICFPEGAGGNASLGGSAGADSTNGGRSGADSARGGASAAGKAGETEAAGLSGSIENDGGSSGARDDGPSSGGEAAAGTAGNDSHAAAGAAGSAGGGSGACTQGPIACAPGGALANSGKFSTSGSADLVALDDTTLLVGNVVASQLDIFDLCSGTATKSYPLPAKPGDIAFNVTSRTAYVVLRGQPAIAKVELESGRVTSIAVPKPALALALGNHGRLFARLEDQNSLPRFGVSIVDGDHAVLLNTFYDDWLRSLIVYDRHADRLITGSDLEVRAYSFDETTSTLSLAEYNTNVGGGNCQQLLLSPDERHLILMCGGGNDVTTDDPPYQIVDVDPAHLQVLYGFYSLGDYPSTATFSPGSKYLYTFGYNQVVAFDVATRTRIRSYPMVPDQLSVSPSGRVLVGRAGGGNVTTYYWVLLREASDCQ